MNFKPIRNYLEVFVPEPLCEDVILHIHIKEIDIQV